MDQKDLEEVYNENLKKLAMQSPYGDCKEDDNQNSKKPPKALDPKNPPFKIVH